jgi:uncharacterized membrane protein
MFVRPRRKLVHSEADLWNALAPELVTYLMSFLTLGIFWNGQQVQLQHLERSDRKLTWLQLWFLFAVTLMPFSTRLLAEVILYRPALLVQHRRALGAAPAHQQPDAGEQDVGPVKQPSSAAALCFLDTRISIAFIVVVQLNYVIASGFRRAR